MDVLARFFQNKEAPVLSFVTALMQGQNSLGEKTNVPTEIVNRSIPLMVQDMYDLYKEWGPEGIAMGLPGILGVGSQTYGSYELVKGQNQIGQNTAQLKPKKGLGEQIAGMFGVEPDLSSTPGFAVSSYVDDLQALPKEEAAQKFEEIRVENPKLAEKIVKEIKDRELGITEEDKGLRSKGVANGDRAMAIAEELQSLETKEEKAKLWADYVTKKIITKDVAEQLNILLNKSE
jgi:RNase H-fold protein (predicted Holliday junction resolvase)